MTDPDWRGEACAHEDEAGDQLFYVVTNEDILPEPVDPVEVAKAHALLGICARLAALDETLRGRPL